MNYERGVWVKYYRNHDMTWLSLPQSTRGVAAELLLHCDESGFIPTAESSTKEDKAKFIIKLLRGHKNEALRIMHDVYRLFKEGYLSDIDIGGIKIKNFEKAQARRTSTERVREFRRRGRAAPASNDESSREAPGGSVVPLRRAVVVDVAPPPTSAPSGTEKVVDIKRNIEMMSELHKSIAARNPFRTQPDVAAETSVRPDTERKLLLTQDEIAMLKEAQDRADKRRKSQANVKKK